MKIFICFSIIFLFSSFLNGQNISIKDCDSFQKISTNNDTVIYQFIQNLDCSDTTFYTIGDEKNQFMGVIDGKGFEMKNLRFTNENNLGENFVFLNNFFQIFKTNKFFFKGLFAYGNGCKIYNLTISDVELETNSNNVAIVFSRCENCKMDNIEITTSSEEKRNKIEGAQNVGGLASILENSEIRNCSISNTDFFSTCKSQVSMGSFASIVSHSIMGDCSIKNNNFLVWDLSNFRFFHIFSQDY